MSRSDDASITFKVSCPPAAIKAYFDGLAKVEAAKHRPGLDLSGLATLAIPFLTGFMKSACDTACPKTSFTPFSMPSSSCTVTPDDDTKCNSDVGNIIISFMNSDDSTRTVKMDDTCTDESCPKETCDDEHCTDEKKEPCPIETSAKEPCPSATETSAKEPCADEKKQRRPVYQDGENVVLDFNNIAGAFGGAGSPNAAGIADMMKMFAPMMEGLMGGMNAATAGATTNTAPVRMAKPDPECDKPGSESDVSEGNID